jgi:hypothetical protein
MASAVQSFKSVGQLRKKLRWKMNFTKNIKWQLVLAALAASLLMTSAARAQEIDNSTFEPPATSVAGNFNTPSAAAANQAVTVADAEYAAVSQASIMPVDQQEEAGAAGIPRTLGTILAIGVLLIACGLLWKSESGRRNDTLKIHNSLSMRKTTLPNRKAQAQHS